MTVSETLRESLTDLDNLRLSTTEDGQLSVAFNLDITNLMVTGFTHNNLLTFVLKPGVLGENAQIFSDVKEQFIVENGEVVEHTLTTLDGNTYNYADVAELGCVAVRNDEFTGAFQAEIAAFSPEHAEINYYDAVELLGTSGVEQAMIDILH